MKYKHYFNQQPALRFRQFTRKRWALFACLGRVVTISVLSVATLKSASAATDDVATKVEFSNDDQSADKEVKLRDLEVTGSLAPLATGQAARMVTVLSREEIQAAPVQSINDLLKMVCAVDVRQRGAIGAQTDVSIRGGTQEQVTILLNGINICDPQTAHNTMDMPCDVSDIVRIEVLEGPAGRIYGTSSMVGAINIVTKSHEYGDRRQKAEVRMEGGSFGYLSAAARTAFNAMSSTLSNTFSAGYTRSDGFSRSKAGHLNADYEGAKAFYQGAYERERTRLLWHAGISTKGFGSNTFYSARYDEQFEQTTKMFTALQGEFTNGPLHLKQAIYWNRGHDRFELIRGSEAKVPFNHHRTDVFGLNVNSWFDWVWGRTAIGAEFRNEDIVSTNLGETLNESFGHYKNGLNRTNLSFHAEHNIMLNRFTLSAGFVAVKNTWNQMPFTIYPGVDVSYRMNEHLRLYASYNSSLRMPSFTELYYSVGGHKADKYLKPEELRALQGGINYNSRHLNVKACIFHHHSQNMIDWVMDTRATEPIWQSVNHTVVNTLGEEITARLHSKHYTLNFSYSHLHQQKDEKPYIQSQYSLEYLRHKLTASLMLPIISHLSIVVNYRFQDRAGSYTNTNGIIRDYSPYSIVDSRLNWDTKKYALYLEVNNLFDTHYVDYGNVPQPGCWVIAGAKYYF